VGVQLLEQIKNQRGYIYWRERGEGDSYWRGILEQLSARIYWIRAEPENVIQNNIFQFKSTLMHQKS
jgi:hypothetical protein